MSEELGTAEVSAPNPQTEAAVVEAAAPEAAAPVSILDNFQDADLRSYAEGKGFDKAGFEGLVKSYSNLEKMSRNHESTVVIPGMDATPDESNAFYNRLGRPDAPDAYSFALPEGADTARLDGLRGIAHELGITDKQFSGLAEADSQYFEGVNTQNNEAAQLSAVDAEHALRQEWGAAFDQNVAHIEQYANQLGMTQENLEGLRNAMGPVDAMKFVHSLGGKMGEDSMDTGESVANAMLTPAAAKLQLSELHSDKDFTEAWLNKTHPAHASAMEKKARLSRQAAGEAP